MPQSPVSTVVAPTTHIYHRVLDPNGQDSLAKLARQIAPGSRVLDLGAGPGVLGRYLREERGCTVDGVEYNPVAAAEAAPWYGQLECADLEGLALAERFAAGQYDYIVCADILEHLRQPGEILAQLTRLLAPNGRVLVSVPNVAYAGLIAEMLAGEFRYRPEGLLDETHLRFFNRTSLIQLLEDHGLRVAVLDATFVDLGDIGPLAGKPVMEGKGCLFKKFAGIDVFDIELAENDPDKLIEIIAAMEPTLGGINLEDIKAPECFYIEQKLRDRMNIPVFHDDQHGTAIISAAAMLNGLELVGKSIGDVKVAVSGAGERMIDFYTK